MVERRNFQRVPFATEAEINCNEKKYYGELLDISLQGALIHGKGTIPFEEGDICELSIHLSGSEITRFSSESPSIPCFSGYPPKNGTGK